MHNAHNVYNKRPRMHIAMNHKGALRPQYQQLKY